MRLFKKKKNKTPGLVKSTLVINEEGLKFYNKTKEDYIYWCEEHNLGPTVDENKKKYFDYLSGTIDKSKDVIRPIKAEINKSQELFILTFNDNTIVTTRWEDADYFDHYIAFAICMTEKFYGSPERVIKTLDSIFRGNR